MLYLICFDISCNRRRYRVVRCLLNYGRRVQKSVFECRLPPAQRRALAADLARLDFASGDGLRIYRICQNCEAEIESFGPRQPAALPLPAVW